MTGIADVAARAGVSPATASRALTGRGYVAAATRLRVETVARELGYAASSSAAGLVTGRTRTIGVVMPSLTRWFFAEVLEGVQHALLEHRYDLALYSAPSDSALRRAMFDFFLTRKRLDGIIAIGIEPSAHELERLISFARPVVSVGGHHLGTSAVSIDDRAAARIATEHLIGLGHRDIAFLGGDPDGRHTSFGDGMRLAGYRDAMHEAGLDAFVRHTRCVVSMPGGYGAGATLLADRRRRPTGLVGVCDEVAVGAIIAARRLGIRVPSDLSVIGIDDHHYAEMFSLTTLQQRPFDQGVAAVQLLMRQLEDPDAAPERIHDAAPIVMRGTTAAHASSLAPVD